MAKGHTTGERRLLDDIRVKNGLRVELEHKLRLVEEWKAEVETGGKRSKGKRLLGTIARFEADIERLKKEILERGRDLEPRIREEMKASEQEVADFRDQYKKEFEGFLKARDEFEKEKGKKRVATTKSVLRRIARARKRLKKEGADVQKVQAELDSEAKDKIVLADELRRVTSELAHYE